MKDFAGAEYWLNASNDMQYTRHDKLNPNYQLIRKFVNNAEFAKEVLELGSYPGSMISEFGELGYMISGVDIHPENCQSLPRWLKSKGYFIGEFITEDVFKFE